VEVSESCEISGHPVGLEAGGDAVPPRYIEGASPETAAHRRGDLVYLPGPFFLDALDETDVGDRFALAAGPDHIAGHQDLSGSALEPAKVDRAT